MISKDEVRDILWRESLYLIYEHFEVKVRGRSLGKDKSFEIGPKSNYNIQGSGVRMISRVPHFRSISLEDVLLNGQEPPERQLACYDVNLLNISEEDGRIKVEVTLQYQTDFLFPPKGMNHSGKTLSGYVREIKRG